jgi:glycine dehydrogenase subunit 1
LRYLPHTDAERGEMLAKIGVRSIDDLYADVPAAARLEGLVELPLGQGEIEVERHLSALAGRNVCAGSSAFFVGAGAYRHHIPASVDHLIQRSEFLTAYTPYQPEISQGTLQTLFEFQTQVATLTGMEVANGGMYDGSTAAAEAVQMARRVTRRHKAVLSGGLHPQYRDVIHTLATMSSGTIDALPGNPGAATEDIISHIDSDTACVVVQSPSFYGELIDLAPIAEACHANGALLVAVVTEIISMGAIESPGAQGADIVAAEGQSLGNALGFGGPYVGLLATREKFLRQMPGRLCGETVDAAGKRGFVLTLSTREQHIRRDKATSNICTSSGLCALAFSIHLSLLGGTGLSRLARINHAKAIQLADALAKVDGVTVLNDTYFNELTIRVDGNAATLVEKLAERGVLGGVPVSRLEPGRADLADLVVLAATELTTDDDIQRLATALGELLPC